MSGIPISEKHGVNPCIPICFWCGKEKNEIALLGKLKGDVEAPMHAVINYEPCDDCKAIMDQGVTFAESEDGKTPTGRFFILKKESARTFISRCFHDVDVETIMSLGRVYLEPEAFNMVCPKRNVGESK